MIRNGRPFVPSTIDSFAKYYLPACTPRDVALGAPIHSAFMSDWDRDKLKREMDARIGAQITPRKRSVEFEAFVSEVALADHSLTDAEIDAGLVGGSRDGALDAVYVFVNTVLITEDSALITDSSIAATYRDPVVELWLVQAKESAGFSDNAIILARAGSLDLLALDRDETALLGKYSEEVIVATRLFVQVMDRLLLSSPTVEIKFVYGSTADSAPIHENVIGSMRDYEAAIATAIRGARVEGITQGAEDMVAYMERRPTYDKLPLVAKELLPVGDGPEGSFVLLVTLGRYIEFLTDQNGKYRAYLFTDNVRDYDRGAKVNKEIVETLNDTDSPEFWWLNNGVTIIGSKVEAPSKRVVIDDVQIVNGLQTSQSIWEVLKDKPADDPLVMRTILIRVIPTTDTGVRNQIIRATNSQTPVTDEGLRATSRIHLEIEEFLLSDGYFYDRRRNFYKNMGKPRNRIVGIRELTQALLTWTKFRPDEARARPRDYLRDDSKHDAVFNRNLPQSIFSWVVEAQQRVESYLASSTTLETSERTDYRFLVSAVIAKKLTGRQSPASKRLLESGSPVAAVTDSAIKSALAKVQTAVAAKLKADPKARRDQLVKNAAFVDSVTGAKRSVKTR
jgi:hypothetical protein